MKGSLRNYIRMKEESGKRRKLPLLGSKALVKTHNSKGINLANISHRTTTSRSKSVGKVPHLLMLSTKKMKEMEKIDGSTNVKEQKWNLETYTEDDAKQLGDYKIPWILFRDGYENGRRLYDKFNGRTCHQCRQKTLGLRTQCSRCKGSTGMLCGDCLYIRYGENIIEANENGKSWICPVCRGICNCSKCRNKKGLPPIPCIYSKALRNGYKSVAHYLIKTHIVSIGGEGETTKKV
ncbi:cell division cycle-associated protein 7-like [Olea europaea var. sylvestris]|uniref:cell division cycle-associated protein 7-like n=1 Tax=Olea europaea var. sylvestris TaxID=158386 RepID=UPI000C1D53C8|nr:cell division cycle-associated protein 7-like [Olea europaea var. sylvestris]